jgi:hypothetical protein
MRSSAKLRGLGSPRSIAGALPRMLAAALVACAAALVSGCSGLIADHLPVAAGGLSEDAPARPTTDTPYPAVHSMPPARSTTPLSYDQQKQLEDDLIAARNRYGASTDAPAATTPAATPPAATTPAATTPAATGTSANAKAGSARNP